MTLMPVGQILEPLQTPPPEVGVTEVLECVRQRYGLSAEATLLTSERDQNFRLKVKSGQQYVLKIANTAESHEVAFFQSAALNHIARIDPALPVPRVVPTLEGQDSFLLDAGGGQALVRMLTYLEGEPIHLTRSTPDQRFNIGRMSARLAWALRDFSHPAADHQTLWDIRNAGMLRDLMAHIPDPSNRALAERFLDRYDSEVSHALPAMRSQVVHNDFNPHNLLVQAAAAESIAGILDFGDMVYTALINDVAVTASYLLEPSDRPLTPVVDMLRGYQTIFPLERAELRMLPDLIATRYVMNVAITGWRAARYPHNQDYILRNNAAAWAGLRTLERSSTELARNYLCEQSHPFAPRSS